MLRDVPSRPSHPLKIARAGQLHEIGDGGLLVGIIDAESFDRIVLQLEPGDRLILYSDGVTDCEDTVGAPWGDEEFHAILSNSAHVPMTDILDDVRQKLVQWRGSTKFNDDVSVLAVEMLAP